MTTEHTTTGLIGAPIRRVEDAPLITGKGCYTEDIQLPGMLHLAFLRSPYPHAKIISIDANAAKAMAGVVAVVTGDDLGERLHVPAFPMVPGMKMPPIRCWRAGSSTRPARLWPWWLLRAALSPRMRRAPSLWNMKRCPQSWMPKRR